MEDQKECPQCQSPYCYPDGTLWICPECAYEFSDQEDDKSQHKILDANGNELQDGDSVTVIKDLKVKGSSAPIKVGTKVKNIRLNPDSGDGHDIDCKIPGFGQMGLKSEFVKKIQ